MGPSSDSRGQLLVVVALLVATTLVALALVLNSAIFAENLSSRETTDSEAAIAYAADANRTVAQAVTRTADAEVATADGARAVFDGIVDDWARSRSATAAERGGGRRPPADGPRRVATPTGLGPPVHAGKRDDDGRLDRRRGRIECLDDAF
ncbi:hypothetical protein GJ631_15925 [Natronomonas sp. CBA1123]|uniref:hypothetical protein n=1 Tax=Natronomonas sp. CBA1123 TaxID=2668070 RepID=UPI0012E9A257|nr:hypothetical protein [Natronomonas sp. CBA1123]MUV88000.1 hypothetical protein [Natronomonas sp. CBA1123]